MDESNHKKFDTGISDLNSVFEVSSQSIEEITEDRKRPSWSKLVGNTTFTESRNLAQKIPCERLFLKFEGNNPTGTQKDRIAFAISEIAKKRAFNGITTATCGNYGAAIAFAANFFKLPEVHIFIPQGYHLPKSRADLIRHYNGQIHYVEGTYEDAVRVSSGKAIENNWFDANPGTEGLLEVSLDAYAEIAIEIYRSIRRAPDYLFCPVGNGTTFAGIHWGFKNLYIANKISHLPRMIATSTRRGNPIIKSFKMKSRHILDLSPEEIKETKVNEPLTNWHSFDGQVALSALYESNGFAEYASDSQMMEFSRLLREEEGLNVHPASASTLAVLASMTKNDMPLKGTYVAILTGRDM